MFASCAFLVFSATAQENDSRKTFGDPAIKEAIAAKTGAIYEKDGDSLFVLTQGDVLGLNSLEGTEINAKFSDGYFTRIVAGAFNEYGKYQVEFYLEKDVLLFSFETFEYYLERSPKSAWKNFKGLAAWERRSYFSSSKIVYAETRGVTAPKAGNGSLSLSNTAYRLLRLFKKQLKKQQPKVVSLISKQ